MAREYPPSRDEIRLWELASGHDNKTTNWNDESIREYHKLVEKLSGGEQAPEVKKRRNRVANSVTRVLEGTEAA